MAGEAEIDRLSNLPDELLTDILSFLTTENAVATSSLSKRWQKLFISLHDIDLNYTKDWYPDEDESDMMFSNFLCFGFKMIQQQNGHPIRKFRIYVNPFAEVFRLGIYSLIYAAISCEVRELALIMPGDETHALYPPMIFNLEKLVSLEIKRNLDWIIPEPDSVSLPNLKVLSLEGTQMIDADSFGRLIQGCPLLEELKLCFYNLENQTGFLDISCPLMKKLKLDLEGIFTVIVSSNNLEYVELLVGGKHTINLNAPNLKCMSYKGYAIPINFHQNLVSLARATIALRFHPSEYTQSGILLRCNLVLNLIGGLQCVKSLHLDRNILLALCYVQRLLLTLPNLTILILDDSIYPDFDIHHGYLWKTTSRLLERAPNLEVLIFDGVFRWDFSAEEFVTLLPAAIPACSIQHLKEIKIKNLKEQEYQIKLVEYFLQNGRSLKRMTLGGVIKPGESWSEDCNRILSFKKCSQDCEIVFIMAGNWHLY